jgi:hypothetical protein
VTGIPHPVHIRSDEYARRIRALLGRGGLAHALPRRERDRWIVLHAIARRFAPGERLSERDAGARIADFLIGPGHYLELDRGTLRRALVDDGFLDRDPAGNAYRISARHRRRVVFEEPPQVEAVLGLAP